MARFWKVLDSPVFWLIVAFGLYIMLAAGCASGGQLSFEGHLTEALARTGSTRQSARVVRSNLRPEARAWVHGGTVYVRPYVAEDPWLAPWVAYHEACHMRRGDDLLQAGGQNTLWSLMSPAQRANGHLAVELCVRQALGRARYNVLADAQGKREGR